MISLQISTSDAWINVVIAHFDRFLPDHAAAEKKAAGMAISMLSHYPDRTALVTAMADLAVEEMTHFREVLRLMQGRGLQLQADSKDPYMNAIRGLMRKGSEPYFLDRLLVAGIVEARGAERFGLIADALPAGRDKVFYQSITRSEDRHRDLFLELAQTYFSNDVIEPRLQELLTEEARIIGQLAVEPRLH